MPASRNDTAGAPLDPRLLPPVLSLLSFASVLFTIVLFRLLTFVIMPSLFFDLLFTGFALGALAGAYFFRVGRQALLGSLWQYLALLAPVAFVTGSFFPALFEAAAENPQGIFAADSIGAAIGSMASFFIPIVSGFSWSFTFATVMFSATALATFLFFRNLDAVPLRLHAA